MKRFLKSVRLMDHFVFLFHVEDYFVIVVIIGGFGQPYRLSVVFFGEAVLPFVTFTVFFFIVAVFKLLENYKR
jgi:hypothetical protein